MKGMLTDPFRYKGPSFSCCFGNLGCLWGSWPLVILDHATKAYTLNEPTIHGPTPKIPPPTTLHYTTRHQVQIPIVPSYYPTPHKNMCQFHNCLNILSHCSFSLSLFTKIRKHAPNLGTKLLIVMLWSNVLLEFY